MSKELFDCYSEVVKNIVTLSKKRYEKDCDIEIFL